MPWFETKPVSGVWGWHWTMGKTDPGQGKLASHYTPDGGPYDSGDAKVVERQVRTMKASGFDGILVDWYGVDDVYDYPVIHRNTKKLFDAAEKAGLKIGVVYEDQTARTAIATGKAAPGSEVATVRRALSWLEKEAFSRPSYVRWKGRPLFPVFGPQALLKQEDWDAALKGFASKPLFMGVHHLKFGAGGGFGWPLPQGGEESSWKELTAYYERAKDWPVQIAIAYPRFKDYYKAAGVSDGYPTISDDNGATFAKTMDLAIKSSAPYIQIATWNDWGEGTQVEPSKEFGLRDLLVVLRTRKKLDPDFSSDEAAIRRAWRG